MKLHSDLDHFRCGSIAILGRPNVGKSTLLNACLQKKLSITSKKPQTTWRPILGIHTDAHAQYIFYDTPGFQTHYRDKWHLELNHIAESYDGLDLLILVLEAGRLTPDDYKILQRLACHKRQPNPPKILFLANKIDLWKKPRESLLPWLQKLAQTCPFEQIIPLSAYRAQDIERLLPCIRAYLPIAPAIYPQQQDVDLHFFAAEVLREKIFRLTGDELPYVTTVTIDRIEAQPHLQRIFATIWVNSVAQRKILIGSHGEKLKQIASSARVSLEKLLGDRVFLNTWVKLH